MDSPRILELRRRIQRDPASVAFAALAEEYRRTGRFDEAIDVCRAGLQRHPSYISAHVTLGRALLETGRNEEARRELEYVLTVAPENLAAIRALADIHGRQGEPQKPEIRIESRSPALTALESSGENPVLGRLETFLQAIRLAREAAGDIHVA